MKAELQFTDQLLFAVAAILMVLATASDANSQSAESKETVVWPNAPMMDTTSNDQYMPRKKSPTAAKPNPRRTHLIIPLHASPHADPYRNPDMGFGSNIGHANNFNYSGTPRPIDQFQFGNSYFGIQTQKSLQTPETFRRSDCATDDECADYSGLPTFKNPKKGISHARKPFVGISVRTPMVNP